MSMLTMDSFSARLIAETRAARKAAELSMRRRREAEARPRRAREVEAAGAAGAGVRTAEGRGEVAQGRDELMEGC